jgi:hypothetical protein
MNFNIFVNRNSSLINTWQHPPNSGKKAYSRYKISLRDFLCQGFGQMTFIFQTFKLQSRTSLKSEHLAFFISHFNSLGGRGGKGRLLYSGVQDQYYIETRTDDLFLFLNSILFVSRGGNGRLLCCGVQDQYYIETRTDDISITHFNSLWEQGREWAAAVLRGAGPLH